MRVAGDIFLGLMLVGLALGFLSFDAFRIPAGAEIRRASAAVVFTGAFERVDAGLRLLAAGGVTRLYISGVNAGAGILPADFVTQFSARNPGLKGLRQVVQCCVEWGEFAENTFENARDTKCWVDRRELSGSLLLITSRLHMARAIAALSGALPGRALVPYPVEDAAPSGGFLRERAWEYLKYLGTIVAVRSAWIAGRAPHERACPSL